MTKVGGPLGAMGMRGVVAKGGTGVEAPLAKAGASTSFGELPVGGSSLAAGEVIFDYCYDCEEMKKGKTLLGYSIHYY